MKERRDPLEWAVRVLGELSSLQENHKRPGPWTVVVEGNELKELLTLLVDKVATKEQPGTKSISS